MSFRVEWLPDAERELAAIWVNASDREAVTVAATLIDVELRKPLAEFSVEDHRIMVGQDVSLPILIPLAVERLEQEPLAEGDFYPGDLLQEVLRVGEPYWSSHPDSLQRVRKIVERVKESLPIL